MARLMLLPLPGLLLAALLFLAPVTVLAANGAEVLAETSAASGTTISDDLDDYSVSPEDHVADPLESWNRMWFHFNDFVLLKMGKPLYSGYEAVTPSELRTGVRNFFHNVLFPVRFVNALLQGEFLAAGVEFDRFMINTIVGFGGFIDVAKKDKPIVEPDVKDMGQTFGRWGMGEGIYLVWPFFGPSTLRDTAGMAGDYFLDPTWILLTLDQGIATNTYREVNNLGPTIDTYEGLKSGSVEPYTAMRDAYIQMRRNIIER